MATVKQLRIYNTAVTCVEKHITLDPSVPAELGCAEAVSYILKLSGFTLPAEGIAGTAALYTWLEQNFTPVSVPQYGDVIISPSGMSVNGSPHGHTGIVAKYGILSNDSDSGLFLEKYILASWAAYFHTIEGFPVFYFRSK